MVDRKKFIRLASLSFGTLLIPDILLSNTLSPSFIFKDEMNSTPGLEMATVAIKMARQKGASYTDVRIEKNMQQGNNSFSLCLRVLVDGTWGFAATEKLTSEEVKACVANAFAAASENRGISKISKRYQYASGSKPVLWRCDTTPATYSRVSL